MRLLTGDTEEVVPDATALEAECVSFSNFPSCSTLPEFEAELPAVLNSDVAFVEVGDAGEEGSEVCCT
jgi:hypothetical protein